MPDLFLIMLILRRLQRVQRNVAHATILWGRKHFYPGYCIFGWYLAALLLPLNDQLLPFSPT